MRLAVYVVLAGCLLALIQCKAARKHQKRNLLDVENSSEVGIDVTDGLNRHADQLDQLFDYAYDNCQSTESSEQMQDCVKQQMIDVLADIPLSKIDYYMIQGYMMALFGPCPVEVQKHGDTLQLDDITNQQAAAAIKRELTRRTQGMKIERRDAAKRAIPWNGDYFNEQLGAAIKFCNSYLKGSIDSKTIPDSDFSNSDGSLDVSAAYQRNTDNFAKCVFDYTFIKHQAWNSNRVLVYFIGGYQEGLTSRFSMCYPDESNPYDPYDD